MSASAATSTRGSRYDQATLDDIRSREPISGLFERFGNRLRKTGPDYVCLCPFHAEKTPSCTISDRKGFFHCHGCGAGGDAIDAVMRLKGCPFPEAVDFLGGARELTEFDVARVERARRDRDAELQAERQRTTLSVERLWGECLPIRGTIVADYLAGRGLYPSPEQVRDLRVHPRLDYRGFADAAAEDATRLGAFPAMVAAIRGPEGQIIGLHRTYIDPETAAKLAPPGDRTRNRAKKILGEHRGGLIRLSASAPRMAYGEGIETTLSWYALGGGGEGEIGLASAVSLGNLCGSATGSVEHPTRTHPDGRPLKIPNGKPDLDRPGLLPAEGVHDAILIGDGDSDGPGTRMRLLTAARRWRAAAGCMVSISMAPDGADFNDVLLAVG